MTGVVGTGAVGARRRECMGAGAAGARRRGCFGQRLVECRQTKVGAMRVVLEQRQIGSHRGWWSADGLVEYEHGQGKGLVR